jgi:micrococcal nuclease
MARLSSTLYGGLLPDGNVNQELVKQDWCWWYRKYALGNTELERLEAEAQEAKKGLWANPQPVPPWEWRKQKSREGAGLCLAVGALGVNLRHS